MNTFRIRRLFALALLSSAAPLAIVACGGGGDGPRPPAPEQVAAVYTGSAFGYQAGASAPFLRFDFTQTTFTSGRSQTELSICNLTPVSWCFSYSGVVRVNFVQWGYAGSVSGLPPFACNNRGVVSTNPARIDLGVTTFSLSGIGGCVRAFTAEAGEAGDIESPAMDGRSLHVMRATDGAAWSAELRTAEGAPDRAFSAATIEANGDDRQLAALADDRGAVIALQRASEGAIELLQLGPAGQVDVAFGAEGRVWTPGAPSSLALGRDAGGRILVAWVESRGARVIVERRLPGGAVDAALGGVGRVELDAGRMELEVEALDVDAHGRILLGARLRSSEFVMVWRLAADGEVDSRFGDRGLALATLRSASSPEARVSLRATTNGSIAVAARTDSVLLDEHGAELARLSSVEPIEGFSPGFEPAKPDRRGAWGAARAK